MLAAKVDEIVATGAVVNGAVLVVVGTETGYVERVVDSPAPQGMDTTTATVVVTVAVTVAETEGTHSAAEVVIGTGVTVLDSVHVVSAPPLSSLRSALHWTEKVPLMALSTPAATACAELGSLSTMAATRAVDSALRSLMVWQSPADSSSDFFSLKSSSRAVPATDTEPKNVVREATSSWVISSVVVLKESAAELRLLLRLAAADFTWVASPEKSLTEASSWVIAVDTVVSTALSCVISRASKTCCARPAPARERPHTIVDVFMMTDNR